MCAFGRLRPYLGEQKSKLLLNSVVISNFSYCPLIWLFCSKVANNEINRTHKCALRTLDRDYESTFEELLDRGDTKTTHKKNLQNLMVEIYKSMDHLNPEYMWDFFIKKDVSYNLRTEELCKLHFFIFHFNFFIHGNPLNNKYCFTGSHAKTKSNNN